MGAWGFGPFENDDALDWMEDFYVEGVSAVEAAFQNVSSSLAEGFIDSPEASMAVAAAEIVAAAHGVPMETDNEVDSEILSRALSNHADALAAANDLIPDALSALDLIMTDPEKSELLGLWSEAEVDPANYAGFKASVADLRARLERLQ